MSGPARITSVCMVLSLCCLMGLPGAPGAERPAGAEWRAEENQPRSYPPGEAPEGIRGENGDRITLNLKNVPIEDFLDAMSKRTEMRFVLRPAVRGREISAFLPDVRVGEALDAVMAANHLAYERVGENILVVKERERRVEGPEEREEEIREDPLQTHVIELRYSEAEDIRQALAPLLTTRGTLEVVQKSGWVGWHSGANNGGGRGGTEGIMAPRRRAREDYSRNVRSQLLVVRDTEETCDLVQSVIGRIDMRPDQILIAANLIEARQDKLQDIGVNWATGSTGIEGSDNIVTTNPWGGNLEFRGNILGARTTPRGFQSPSGAAGTFPFNAGMTLLFKKIGGSEYEALLHALHERADANTLSSPKLLTLDNQVATILVGQRFPILRTDVSGTDVTQLTTSLDYYENIGIQLNVIPQIQGRNSINMVIHPVVSQQTGTVAARGTNGITVAEYPIIDTRETETQVMIEDGQTIGIGGLLREIETEDTISVPLLGSVPILGRLFRRETNVKQKQDLIIFLSATIIRSPEEATREAVRDMGGPDEKPARALMDRAAELREQGDYEKALRLLQQVRDSFTHLTEQTTEDVKERIRELKQLQKQRQ